MADFEHYTAPNVVAYKQEVQVGIDGKPFNQRAYDTALAAQKHLYSTMLSSMAPDSSDFGTKMSEEMLWKQRVEALFSNKLNKFGETLYKKFNKQRGNNGRSNNPSKSNNTREAANNIIQKLPQNAAERDKTYREWGNRSHRQK